MWPLYCALELSCSNALSFPPSTVTPGAQRAARRGMSSLIRCASFISRISVAETSKWISCAAVALDGTELPMRVRTDGVRPGQECE
eukprot:517371-Prymnesium_polylepis.3